MFIAVARSRVLFSFGAFSVGLIALGAIELAACKGKTLSLGVNNTPGCTLPVEASGPLVRFANLVPTGDLADVCIRPAGATSWGLPILFNGGTGCPSTLGGTGFAYSQVSIAFSAPAASVDVKAVAGGSTCDAAALSEGDGLTLATNAVTTLVSIGSNGIGTSVVALPESDSNDPDNLRIRFVHAMPGTAPLDLGLFTNDYLPTTIAEPLLPAPVAFGTVPPSGGTLPFGFLQDNGYFGSLPTSLNVGAAIDDGHGCSPSGSTRCSALFVQTEKDEATLSLYAVGIAGDDAHPQRGLICDENPANAGKAINPDLCPPGAPVTANPLLTPSCGTALPNISVDVFNAALYGPGAPDEPQRASLMGPALGQRNSDVLCLVEVDSTVDQQAIISATAGRYPYSYAVSTDLDTPFTNPQNQAGQTPLPPTAPPCAGVPSALVNTAIQCGEQSCSTDSADGGSGDLAGTTACISSNCAGPFINIQGSTPGNTDGAACFDCLITYIASNETWAQAQTSCTTDVRAPLAFEGQSSTMVLSRFPLVNTDALVLPSTLFRQTVLYAQVQLQDQSVDFYCGKLTSTFNGENLPYTGNYGGDAGASSVAAWDNENLYQAQQLITWVALKSGSNPAIVVGDWRSSQGLADDAGAPGGGESQAPATMNLFQSASGWTFAVGQPPWTPQCNFCPGVLGNGPSESYFVVQPMLVNWPQAQSATTSESLIFTSDVSLGDAGVEPLSPYYGVNVQVLRPKN